MSTPHPRKPPVPDPADLVLILIPVGSAVLGVIVGLVIALLLRW